MKYFTKIRITIYAIILLLAFIYGQKTKPVKQPSYIYSEKIIDIDRILGPDFNHSFFSQECTEYDEFNFFPNLKEKHRLYKFPKYLNVTKSFWRLVSKRPANDHITINEYKHIGINKTIYLTFVFETNKPWLYLVTITTTEKNKIMSVVNLLYNKNICPQEISTNNAQKFLYTLLNHKDS